MIELLPYIVTGLACFAAGGGVVAYVKSRPLTTKAEAIKCARVLLDQAAKMGGADEDMELAKAEKTIELAEVTQLGAVAAKLGAQ